MMIPTTNAERNANKKKTTALLVLFLLLLVVLAVLLLTCRTRRESSNTHYQRDSAALQSLQIPAIRPADQIVERTGFALSYNETHEQAAWVAYVLRGFQMEFADENRTNRFLPDPLVKTGTAEDGDYNGSGYDRGHLAPAEDMAWSAVTMRESFYYSNASPQVPAFNRGVWKRLEELVRYWSSAYDSISTVTGPVLTNGLPVIGPNGVSVPRHFYKVVLEYNPKGVRGIGFVVPNEASSANLRNFAVSIDSVERLTGLDFFPRLADDVEEKIESGLVIEDWLWQRKTKK